MMSRLEERYRLVLRFLPASYRQVWEEDMVTAFLASVHTDDPEDADYLADYGRPGWAEVASVAALAVRLRLGLGGGSPRSVAWGAAVRLVALLGLLTSAVFGTVGAGFYLWFAGQFPALPAAPAEWVLASSFDFWAAILHLSGLVWVAAYVALLRGYWQAARALATLGLVPELITTVVYAVDRPSLSPWLYLLSGAVLVLALGAYQGHGPPPGMRPWLLALPVGALGMTGLSLLGSNTEVLWAFLDPAGLYCVGVVGAAVGYLAARLLGRVDPTPSWPHALVMLVAGVLTLRVLTLSDYLLYSAPDHRLTMIAAGLIQAGAVLAVGIPLAVLTTWALRRLRVGEARILET